MDEFTYINGRFVTRAEAVVSVQDRGFRFGDGVFETIAVHGGVPYQWNLHLARLAGGLEALWIECDITELQAVSRVLIAKNGVSEGILRIAISRGVGSQGYLPTGGTPTIVMETMPLPPAPPEPVKLWLSSRRRAGIEVLPVNYKIAQGVGSILARMEAVENECFEAVMLNEFDEICEASSANLFWLKNGTLHTPSLATGALAGTMRAAVMRLSPWPVKEGHYQVDELLGAEAVALTNASWTVVAAGSLEPSGLHWDSLGMAHRLRLLVMEDIARHTAGQGR